MGLGPIPACIGAPCDERFSRRSYRKGRVSGRLRRLCPRLGVLQAWDRQYRYWEGYLLESKQFSSPGALNCTF